MRTFYLFILLFTCSIPILSASEIKGKVIDETTKSAIEYAQVILYSNDKVVAETTTHKNGSFSFNSISNGDYTLLVRFLGYDLYTSKTINKTATTKDIGVIPMKQLEVGIKEVEVVANKKQVIYKLDKRIIEASSNLLATGGTAVDILENTPSIRVTADGEVTFRGSSGFKVYVDGRPSIFSGTQALEQIPSSQIQNIEIITTPSAQYDTDGDVGIINIITKKTFDSGLSGYVSATGSTTGTRSLDFTITQQNKQSRWYVGGFTTNTNRKSNFTQKKTTIVNDTTTTSESEGPRESTFYFYSARGGWSLSKPKTTYSIDLETGYGGVRRDGDLNYSEDRSTNGILFYQGNNLSRDNYDIHETFAQGNLGLNHKFDEKGHKLDARFYLKYGGNALEYFESDLFDQNNKRLQGHRAWEDEHRWTVRGSLDYVLPYSKTGQFKSGYQYFSYLEDGDYRMQYWNPEINDFYWRDDIYNTFYFQRGENSIYTILSDGYKSFDFQVGLRGEHTHQVLESSKTWANRVQNRFEIFPSAHVGYNLPSNQKILASYSRRTNRPQLFFMEPYITYRDYYSAEIGNPDIRPEYINAFELSYSITKDNSSLSTSVFHRSRKDKIERLRVPYHVAGVTLDSMANVGHDYSTGVELSTNLQATKWWNTQVNGSLYYYKVENEFKTGGKNEKSTNYEIAWNNSFDAGKYTRIQFDGNFVGPSVTTQGRTDSFWYFNMAVKQQLFNRKLAATLSFRDMFNTARYVSNITTANLQSYTKIRPHYPLISLTLSYSFNQFKLRSNDSRGSHDLFEGTNH